MDQDYLLKSLTQLHLNQQISHFIILFLFYDALNQMRLRGKQRNHQLLVQCHQ